MAVRIAGQIVLFRFPQTNLGVGKRRPALLIASLPSGYDDWLVSMMSSQTHQTIAGIDELVSPNDPDFVQSGLKTFTVFLKLRNKNHTAHPIIHPIRKKIQAIRIVFLLTRIEILLAKPRSKSPRSSFIPCDSTSNSHGSVSASFNLAQD